MKKLHTHAIFALAFMLGLAMPIATIITARPASAAEQADSASATVSDAAALATALQNPNITTVTLGREIDFANSATIVINRTTPLVLNLNGFNITSTAKQVFAIQQGNVRITGQGTINAPKSVIKVQGSTDPNAANYTVVTIDPEVDLHSGAAYGLAVYPKVISKDPSCYGVVVNFNGKASGAYGLSVHGNVQESNNAPQINIGASAQIISNGTAADNAPIYAAGYAVWNIGAATLTGEMGVGLKAGTFNFNGTKLTATGNFDDPTTGTGGIDGTGVAFQIEHHTQYSPEPIVININGGTYTSANDLFYEYGDSATRSITAPADINITGGTFIAGEGHEIFGGDYAQDDIMISGGTFKGTDVDTFKSRGYLANNLTVDNNGNVVVITSGGSGTTTPTTPDTNKPAQPTTPDQGQDQDKDPSTPVPDTGLNQGVGAISAVATIVPLMIGAGFLLSLYSKRLHKNRQAEIIDDMVSAIDAQPVSAESAREPIIERFEAVAIDRPAAPAAAPVDTFIKK